MQYSDVKTPVYDEALALALEADAVVLVMGDTKKADSATGSNSLPGKQEELIKIIMKTNKPVGLVLINYHAGANSWIAQNVPTIIEADLPISQMGREIGKVLFEN